MPKCKHCKTEIGLFVHNPYMIDYRTQDWEHIDHSIDDDHKAERAWWSF